MRLLPKFPKFDLPDEATARAENRRMLMQREAVIGGKLFGPVPKGHSRQFYCLGEGNWIWQEGWQDAKGTHSITTRYVVRPDGVVKSQNDGPYQPITRSEAKNLYRAAEIYVDKVAEDYHKSVLAA